MDLVGRAAVESVAGGSVDPYALCYRALEQATQWDAVPVECVWPPIEATR